MNPLYQRSKHSYQVTAANVKTSKQSKFIERHSLRIMVDLTPCRKALSYPTATNECNINASKVFDCLIMNNCNKWVTCNLDVTTWIGQVRSSLTNSQQIQRTRIIPLRSTMSYQMKISHLQTMLSKTLILTVNSSSKVLSKERIQISTS